jgi:hypothetical protein
MSNKQNEYWGNGRTRTGGLMGELLSGYDGGGGIVETIVNPPDRTPSRSDLT